LDPDTYLEMVRSEIPAYDELQDLLTRSTAGIRVESVLDLGSGTGNTARGVLSVHPGATLVGIDSSEHMLQFARQLLPDADFRVGRLEEALPAGPFDLVVSAFAIHHLEGTAKANLFHRVREVLQPGGCFVLCDVVVPEQPPAIPVPLDDGIDQPSSLSDQLDWLRAAGLLPTVLFAQGDLCVLAAEKPA
jgi:tRNA (cmo5U34)-methyltransferase